MKLPWYMRRKPAVGLIAGLGGLFTVVELACGQPWAASTAPVLAWKALAASADGTRLVAAANAGTGYGAAPPAPIYISTNAGVTWMQTDTPSNRWTSVASSADGTKLVGAATPWDRHQESPWGDGLIYTSTNSGTTWMPTSAPSNYWTSVASSADGVKLVAVGGVNGLNNALGSIYTSSNSGATWSRTGAPTNNWGSVVSSADGTKLVAVASPWYDSIRQVMVAEGAIYRSLDPGATWTQTSAPSNYWNSVASSADGTKLVAAAGWDVLWNPGLIYTSSDSGATWTQTSAPSNYWSSVACSADGTKVVAVAGQLIYTSSDSGAAWTQTSAPSNSWVSVASSADGSKLVAVDGSLEASMYISTNSGSTWTPGGAPAAHRWTAVASSPDGSHIVAVGDSLIGTLQAPAPAPPLPPSPQLAIGRSGVNLGLSWLVPSTRFLLEESADLRSSNWVDVPAYPSLDFTNLHYRLTLTPSLGSGFYRLKHQRRPKQYANPQSFFSHIEHGSCDWPVGPERSLPPAGACDSVLDVTTKNPFPGMNPFFEQQWRSAHTSLITYLSDALQERLPPDLVARPEAEALTIGAGRLATSYRPDVQVREPLTLKEPGATAAATELPPTFATEPIRVFLEEEIERWLEIREATGRLITVLELLSPSNKLESEHRDRYLRKRRSFMEGGANLVEIDLVRHGAPVFPAPVRRTLQDAGACYGVCVFRTTRPAEQEVYPIRLRERLPAIRVPLRPTEADVVLDLQPLIDQCHERGRYHLLDYRLALDPPLPPEDAAWAGQLLRQHQLH